MAGVLFVEWVGGGAGCFFRVFKPLKNSLHFNLAALKLCFSFAETLLPSETSFSGSPNSLNNLKTCDADNINRMGMICQQLAQVDARTQIGLLKIRMDWPFLLQCLIELLFAFFVFG